MGGVFSPIARIDKAVQRFEPGAIVAKKVERTAQRAVFGPEEDRNMLGDMLSTTAMNVAEKATTEPAHARRQREQASQQQAGASSQLLRG